MDLKYHDIVCIYHLYGPKPLINTNSELNSIKITQPRTSISLSTSRNRQLQVEQWKKREELEATVRSTIWLPYSQNSDVVASTIVVTVDVDKPQPQLNCI